MNQDLLTQEFMNRLDRIETKIDKLDERLDSMELIQDRLTSTVELHEKRSTALEKTQELCKVTCDRQLETLTALVESISQTMDTIKRVFMWVGGAVAFISSVVQIITFIVEMRR